MRPRSGCPGEFDVSQSYIGSADVRRNGRSDVASTSTTRRSRFVLTPRIPLGYLRLGAEWTRYSFGYRGDGHAAAEHVAGGQPRDRAGHEIFGFRSWCGSRRSRDSTARFSITSTPGNSTCPFIIGGTYIYSPDLQFIAGLSVDIGPQIPGASGGGRRAGNSRRDWVFNGVLPAPRLEYRTGPRDDLLRGRGNQGGNFSHGAAARAPPRLDRRLNRALVTFSELRVGAGLVRKVSTSLSLTAEGGCQPYREFDYERADVRYRADGVAPYGQIAARGILSRPRGSVPSA